MSVAISWANKKQLAKCAYMVGFPIFSHIYIHVAAKMISYANKDIAVIVVLGLGVLGVF